MRRQPILVITLVIGSVVLGASWWQYSSDEQLGQIVKPAASALSSAEISAMSNSTVGAKAPSSEVQEIQERTKALTSTFEQLRDLLKNRGRATFDEKRMAELQDALQAEMQSNPHALQWVISQYRANLTTEAGKQLGVILGLMNHAEVVELSQSLVASGSRDEQLAGLDLMARLSVSEPAMRRQALATLNSHHAEVSAAAVFALKRQPTAPEENAQILAGLTSAAQNSDAEVRRRAVIAVVDWAGDAKSLNPVIAAMSDGSALVRGGAAFALGRARLLPLAAETALISHMNNPKENWDVRETAWFSLGKHPMTSTGYSAYTEFSKVRDAVIERSPKGDTSSE